MRSCTVLASQSVALRAVLCSQVVNFEDPALDALFEEVSRHELLFCVHCCAVFHSKSGQRGCMLTQGRPSQHVASSAWSDPARVLYRVGCSSSNRFTVVVKVFDIRKCGAWCFNAFETVIFEVLPVLLLQGDAGKPMKHFHPQYPADADPSLATVSKPLPAAACMAELGSDKCGLLLLHVQRWRLRCAVCSGVYLLLVSRPEAHSNQQDCQSALSEPMIVSKTCAATNKASKQRQLTHV